jgi:hypothetical protein
MTDKELEKIGIIRDGGNLRPNRYWCNTLQDHINILRTDTMEDVLGYIFKEGVERGIKEGKEKRSNEIMGLLKNEDLF